MTSFFEPIIKQHENLPNPLVVPEIAQELSRNYANLKSICATAIAADAVAPALQATLEYMKGFANKQLPTVFTAMQCVRLLYLHLIASGYCMRRTRAMVARRRQDQASMRRAFALRLASSPQTARLSPDLTADFSLYEKCNRMEAFGNHALDLKSEQKPDPVKGDHQCVPICSRNASYALKTDTPACSIEFVPA